MTKGAVNMTKQDIIREAAKRAGYTQETAAAIINAALDTAADALVTGESVMIHQFGKMELRQHKGRRAHNFITGKIVETAASVYVGFVPSKALKARLNDKK